MAKTAKPPVETELKLALTEAGFEALSRHAVFRAAPAVPRHEITTYFDTADQRLRRRGYSLRVRRSGSRFIQTVKAAGPAAVAAQRNEWEWPIGGEEPELAPLKEAVLGRKWPPLKAGEIAPVLVTDIRRAVRDLHLPDGAVAEAAMDQGVIVAGQHRAAVRELELELRDGPPGPLYRLAIELHAEHPLEIAPESKAARGYRLGTDLCPETVKAGRPELGKSVTAAQAFAGATTIALGQLLANMPAAAAGAAEGVHQMRVAIRRLRAALLLFRPCLEPHARRRFEAELRRLGRVFGETRDWDVFCLEVLADATTDQASNGWASLLVPAARDRRREAHAAFATALHAPAFTALTLGLAAWAEDGRDRPALLGAPALERKLTRLTPRLLDRLARKVDRRGRHIATLAGPELHALRKSLKKLRYGIDCVATLYPKKAVKGYVRACKELQQALGDINDTSMALALADHLTEGERADLAPAVAALAHHLAGRRQRAFEHLGRAWGEFTGAERFWC